MMNNEERIEKLEKQVEFLTETLVNTNHEALKLVNEFKDVYDLINDVSKTSVERDIDILNAISLLTTKLKLTYLNEKLES